MAITIICGKSGQGKTAYAVHSLMKYVEQSRALVLSNVPLYFNYIRSWIFVIRIPLFLTKRFNFIKKLPFVYTYTFSSSERVVVWSDLEQIYDVVRLCEIANDEKVDFSLEIANIILKWELKGLSFPLPINREMYSLGFVLFVDEGASYFNSREFRKTPPEFLYLINQHRKMKIDLILTVQRLGSIDNHIRESAHITLLVRKFKLLFFKLNRWHKVIMIDFDPIEGSAGKRVFYDLIRRSRFIESIYDTMFVIKSKTGSITSINLPE
jgi:hypothetical protein